MDGLNRRLRELLEAARLPAGFWTDDGPTTAAFECLAAGVMADRDLTMLGVAMACWDGDRSAAVADLVNVLDNENLRLVAELLRDLADAP
jgi:hypothetical protein